MDYGACMQDEDNITDQLTLNWFKAWLGGMDKISNSESNIKKNFEIQDQYITEVGVQFLTNAFHNYIGENGVDINVNTKKEAQELILDFLDKERGRMGQNYLWAILTSYENRYFCKQV